MTTFGQFIAERRKSLRLTQSDLAGLMQVSQVVLNDLENDRSDPRHNDFLKRFSEVLRVELDDLSDLAERHPEHKRIRKQLEEDEFRSLAAFRISRE